MGNPLLRPLVPLVLSLCLGVGCVRAPPPMAPYATGGVAQAQQSGGQLVGAIGGSTDVWTSQSLSASVDGRLKLGTHFDLGLGGAYGSGGLPKTWAGRFSPRWYTNDLDAPLAIAMELGLSAGQYEGGGVRISSTQQAVPRFRVDFGSVDLPIRFGAAVDPAWEIFWSIGPYVSFAGPHACPSGAVESLSCSSGLLYNGGVLSDVGVQWTHSSGVTVGAQGNWTAGYAPTLLGLNTSAGATLTAGYRFGYVPHVSRVSREEPESYRQP